MQFRCLLPFHCLEYVYAMKKVTLKNNFMNLLNIYFKTDIWRYTVAIYMGGYEITAK